MLRHIIIVAALALLAATPPAQAQTASELAVAVTDYERQGEIFAREGDLTRARTHFTEALQVRRQLARLEPHIARRRSDVARSLDRLSEVVLAQGNVDEARVLLNESLDIRRALVATSSTETTRRALSGTLIRLGDLARDYGPLADAGGYYRESLAIREDISDLTQSGPLADLAQAVERVGGVELDNGETEAALASFRRTLELRERVTALSPTTLSYRRDVAVAHRLLGDALRIKGDLTASQASYAQALALTRTLAAEAPRDTRLRRDLAFNLEMLGYVSQIGDDDEAALTRYQEALVIRRQQTELDPTDLRAVNALADNLSNVGCVSGALDRRRQAEQALNEGIALTERLVQQDANNVLWLATRADLLFCAGDLATRFDDLRTGRNYLSQAVAVNEHRLTVDSDQMSVRRDLHDAQLRNGYAAFRDNDDDAARRLFDASLENARMMVSASPNDPQAHERIWMSMLSRTQTERNHDMTSVIAVMEDQQTRGMLTPSGARVLSELRGPR